MLLVGAGFLLGFVASNPYVGVATSLGLVAVVGGVCWEAQVYTLRWSVESVSEARPHTWAFAAEAEPVEALWLGCEPRAPPLGAQSPSLVTGGDDQPLEKALELYAERVEHTAGALDDDTWYSLRLSRETWDSWTPSRPAKSRCETPRAMRSAASMCPCRPTQKRLLNDLFPCRPTQKSLPNDLCPCRPTQKSLLNDLCPCRPTQKRLLTTFSL